MSLFRVWQTWNQERKYSALELRLAVDLVVDIYGGFPSLADFSTGTALSSPATRKLELERQSKTRKPKVLGSLVTAPQVPKSTMLEL